MQTAEPRRVRGDNHRVGIALWLAAGFVFFTIARIVPIARSPRPIPELLLSLVTAFLLGVLATALDFAGWAEPDWRAGLFTGCGSFAAIGLWRVLQSHPSFRRTA